MGNFDAGFQVALAELISSQQEDCVLILFKARTKVGWFYRLQHLDRRYD